MRWRHPRAHCPAGLASSVTRHAQPRTASVRAGNGWLCIRSQPTATQYMVPLGARPRYRSHPPARARDTRRRRAGARVAALASWLDGDDGGVRRQLGEASVLLIVTHGGTIAKLLNFLCGAGCRRKEGEAPRLPALAATDENPAVSGTALCPFPPRPPSGCRRRGWPAAGPARESDH
eukprot:COSAG01_NODE_860_length_13064_cov_23.466949_2_plen_177_part_00